MRAICTNPTLFGATSRATAANHLAEKLAGKHPHQPPVEHAMDQDASSPTFLRQIPVDPGSYLTSTDESNGPITISGRVAMARAAQCGEHVTSGCFRYSTAEEVAAELERQASRKIAMDAEDLRLKSGKVPFTVQLPNGGVK